MLRRKHPRTTGQALVEFAIIAAGFLMLVFLIIEAARILWAWGTVQSAARTGARFAVTGNFDPVCSTSGIPKYANLCSNVELRRPASVIRATHEGLSGLPLNESVASVFEDTEYYNIEVYGVDRIGQLKGTNLASPFGPDPYAGAPRQPVIVRVTYRVPIITPFFSPILPSIPVFGQTVLYNEPFGQLGGTGQSAGVPPLIPALPTPGVTPSHTPTPTPGPSNTPTATATATATATQLACPVRFINSLDDTTGFTAVTGLYALNGEPYVVNFYNRTVDPNTSIGTATMVPDTGNVHACDGVATVTLPLTSISVGDQVEVRHPDGSSAVIIVQGEPDTPTPTPTNTAVPTDTPIPTTTNTATATPTGPFIQIFPDYCTMNTGVIQVQVFGFNWPVNQTIGIFINNQLQQQLPAGQHATDFELLLTYEVANENTYTVMARSSTGTTSSRSFFVPCPNVTPTPATVPPTNTPVPADLIISRPIVVSTPPIVEYLPVDFRVVITNTGEVDVNNQFFVDIFIDPTAVYPEYIPIPNNPAYRAVDSLPGGGTAVITITSHTGFTGGSVVRQVYGMVDSLRSISESTETNNISGPVVVTVVPSTAQPTPTPNGNQIVSGIVRSFIGQNYVPQHRAIVYIKNDQTGVVISTAETNSSGFYQFTNIPTLTGGGTYTVIACLARTGGTGHPYYAGSRPGVIPPNQFARVNMDLAYVCPAN